MLLEYEGHGLQEPLDLEIARCRLVVAGRRGHEPVPCRQRVATKHSKPARRFFTALGIQTAVIE